MPDVKLLGRFEVCVCKALGYLKMPRISRDHPAYILQGIFQLGSFETRTTMLTLPRCLKDHPSLRLDQFIRRARTKFCGGNEYQVLQACLSVREFKLLEFRSTNDSMTASETFPSMTTSRTSMSMHISTYG